MFNRRSPVFFQTAVMLSLICVAAFSHAGAGKTVAVVESEAYDFGEVFEGADVVHDFIVKNTGDADLEIQSVKAG